MKPLVTYLPWVALGVASFSLAAGVSRESREERLVALTQIDANQDEPIMIRADQIACVKMAPFTRMSGADSYQLTEVWVNGEDNPLIVLEPMDVIGKQLDRAWWTPIKGEEAGAYLCSGQIAMIEGDGVRTLSGPELARVQFTDGRDLIANLSLQEAMHRWETT